MQGQIQLLFEIPRRTTNNSPNIRFTFRTIDDVARGAGRGTGRTSRAPGICKDKGGLPRRGAAAVRGQGVYCFWYFLRIP